MPKDQPDKTAVLYRMVMTEHMCPSGLKARDLLRKQGFTIDDRHLKSRDAVDAFKQEHGVPTTPQIFIDGARIGGFTDLQAHFGQTVAQDGVTYRPVIALFSVAALMALALTWVAQGQVFAGQTFPWFIAIAMILLGLQKLQDVDRFATMFLNYDLLAQRWTRWGYVYPFIETGAGLAMLAGVLTWVAAPAMIFAAGIGAVSVFKAVYVDKRALKCACVGGDSRVPLGFVSLLENVMMLGMAGWMLANL